MGRRCMSAGKILGKISPSQDLISRVTPNGEIGEMWHQFDVESWQ